jgi:uncharacterized membrane protein
MRSKTIGLLVIGFSVLVGLFVLSYTRDTERQEETGCFKQECAGVYSTFNTAHLGLGLLIALLSLGVYLVFFSRGEQALLDYIENKKSTLDHDEKLKIVHMMLDENEQKVFDAIRDQEGITQQMIRIRTNLSKSTVSEILSTFEKKHLISRVDKGKTYSVFLTKDF